MVAARLNMFRSSRSDGFWMVYNDAINLFNTRIQEMPDAMLAGPMGLKPRVMFQVSGEEKAPVNVALTATQI